MVEKAFHEPDCLTAWYCCSACSACCAFSLPTVTHGPRLTRRAKLSPVGPDRPLDWLGLPVCGARARVHLPANNHYIISPKAQEETVKDDAE